MESLVYRCKHFKLEELVSPQIRAILTDEACWRLIPEGIQTDLDNLRVAHGYAITINGAGNTQCGVRAYDCKIGASKSDHKLMKPNVCAFDLHSPQLPALVKLVTERYADFGIYRIENPIYTPTWLHITMMSSLTLPKLEIFNP